jgi:hypothetical protein
MESGPGAAPTKQRMLYRVLTLIFLSTLPCYCAGIFALVAFKPGVIGTIAPPPPPLFLASATATFTPQFTATSTVTPGGPTLTLFPTPTQFVPPPTNTPTSTATNTPLPTDTPNPSQTAAPTDTPTLTPTLTLTLTNTTDPDSDGDGLPDAWEIQYFGDITLWNKDDDPDNDTLLNSEELTLGTDPSKQDTDGDTLTDFEEINTFTTDPLLDDTDSDGMDDGWEVTYQPDLDPITPDDTADPDADTFDNLTEYTAGTDPTDDTSHP